ncbi:MAG TPA: hypothetical protein VHK01_00930 [Lacipirellulaceae bacterium]|jgi:hypothetical protein|nr:hypothetical protein [Lacipirellulaceae bacterium]
MSEGPARAADEPAAELWQLSADLQRAIDEAAYLYDWLEGPPAELAECRRAQKAAARSAIESIASLAEQMEGIRQREVLFRFFAIAYTERIKGCVVREGKYSFFRMREAGSKPNTEPLPYEYVSYHHKALVILDRLLASFKNAEALDLADIAFAFPNVFELSREPDLTSEFIDELRHEAVAAVQVCLADPAGDVEGHTSGDPLLTHIDLAIRFKRDKEATRKLLERWRAQNGDGWMETVDRRQNEPKYLYQLSAVRSLFIS